MLFLLILFLLVGSYVEIFLSSSHNSLLQIGFYFSSVKQDNLCWYKTSHIGRAAEKVDLTMAVRSSGFTELHSLKIEAQTRPWGIP